MEEKLYLFQYEFEGKNPKAKDIIIGENFHVSFVVQHCFVTKTELEFSVVPNEYFQRSPLKRLILTPDEEGVVSKWDINVKNTCGVEDLPNCLTIIAESSSFQNPVERRIPIPISKKQEILQIKLF